MEEAAPRGRSTCNDKSGKKIHVNQNTGQRPVSMRTEELSERKG